MTVAGIVLAGGAARRFGGDKLAVELEGLPLLEHAVAAVAGAADVVIVALAAEAPSRAEAPAGFAGAALAAPGGVCLELVRDPRPGEGPLAGLRSALEHASKLDAARAIVVGGDMPWIRPAVIEALLAGLDDPDVDGCLPVVAGRRQPLPSAIRVVPALAAATELLRVGRRSLAGLFDTLATAELAEPAWRALDAEGWSFRDVDRPADLTAAPGSPPR